MGAGASRERIAAYQRGRADRFASLTFNTGLAAMPRERGEYAQQVTNHTLTAREPVTALADVVDIILFFGVIRASNGGTAVMPLFTVHLPEQQQERNQRVTYAAGYSTQYRQAGEAVELARMLHGRYPTPAAAEAAIRALVARARRDVEADKRQDSADERSPT